MQGGIELNSEGSIRMGSQTSKNNEMLNSQGDKSVDVSKDEFVAHFSGTKIDNLLSKVNQFIDDEDNIDEQLIDLAVPSTISQNKK